METERWLAPLSGGVAISAAIGLVAVYAYGMSLPLGHRATAAVVVAAPIDVAWSLVSDPLRRTEWRPNVEKVGRVDDLRGSPMYRELDPGGDRFEFLVVRVEPPASGPGAFEIEAARPEQIGVRGGWIWTVSEAPGGTRVEVVQHGEIDNPFFRGIWSITTGPQSSIDADVQAIGALLGVADAQ